MKMRTMLAAVALAVALPGAARAQERHAARDTGYLGIYFGWNDNDARTEVREVAPGSPAARAGIHQGDVIVRLNGHAATRDAVGDLREHLERGDTVRLRVRHGDREDDRVVVATARPSRTVVAGPGGTQIVVPGGEHEIVIRMDTLEGHLDSLLVRMDSLRTRMRMRGDSIVLNLQPGLRMLHDSLMAVLPRGEVLRGRVGDRFPFVEFGSRSVAGAEFTEMNPGLARYFHTSEGLLVLQVAPETPAARAGLQSGDVVVEANGSRVGAVRSLREAFSRADGREVKLTVLRDGRRQQLSVRWEGTDVRTFRVETRPRTSHTP